MAIGMTYDEYWYGDVLMARAFYKADQLRQQRANSEAWLYGTYVLRALQATVGNVFREKGEKPSEYPRKPIPLDVNEAAERKAEMEEQEALYAQAYMENMVLAGKHWDKGVRQ